MDTQRLPITIYAEVTPNPSVMKFVANKLLIEQDSVEFKNIDEAKDSPLSQKLFHFPFVKEVFISGNYIAINKYDITEWEEVTMEIRNFISEWLQSGQPVLTSPVKAKDEKATSPKFTSTAPEVEYGNLGDIEKKIVDVLDEYIRPAVEKDGGNIRFVDYKDKTVHVMLMGACSGCPSSTITLKEGILNLYKSMMPEHVNQVEAVNG